MILNIFCKKHPTYEAIQMPRLPKKGDRCHACLILFFLSGNSALNKREIGVRQEGLRSNPKGVLVAKAIK